MGGIPGSMESKPICMECGRVYSSVSNLKQHIANVHSVSPQWEPCPVCGKHFKTRQYLFNHLLQTHGIRQRANRMPISSLGYSQQFMSLQSTQPSQIPPSSHPPASSSTGSQLLSQLHPSTSVSLTAAQPDSQRALTSAVEHCLELFSSSASSKSDSSNQ